MIECIARTCANCVYCCWYEDEGRYRCLEDEPEVGRIVDADGVCPAWMWAWEYMEFVE